MQEKEIDITEKYLKDFIEDLRPDNKEIRKQIDFGYSWDGQIVYLNEIRPQWDNPENILEHPFAKIRYYKSQKEWNLYWMRGTLEWDAYEPYPTATNLPELLKVVREDAYHCFFG